MTKTINLSYIRNDLKIICTRLLDYSFPKKTHLVLILIGIALFLFGLYLVYEDDSYIMNFLVLTAFLGLAIWHYIRDWIRYKRGQQFIEHFLNVHDDMQIFKLVYDHEGISQISSHTKVDVKWNNAKQIEVDTDFIYARESDEKIIIIPSSFMEGEKFEELKEFMDNVDQRLMDEKMEN